MFAVDGKVFGDTYFYGKGNRCVSGEVDFLGENKKPPSINGGFRWS